MSDLVNKLIKDTEYVEIEYKNLVIKLIREKYSMDDEIAIIRQQTTKAEEFETYNAYVEECKAKAKETLGI
ncbi:MAG: hypothetical protein ACI35W_03005 [Anaeroplasmataceae bacterium]